MTSEHGATAQGPLSGIRVLDFTVVMSGPYCTRLLADMGAEVIKIEPPEGDHKRAVPPTRNGHSTPFAQVNAGKKSVVLDLKTAAGKKAAQTLARHSDVVVENWRPGVASRLGLAYPVLSAVRPDLVYCALSGFGQTGPEAGRPAYAPIIHAASGFDMAQMRYDEDAVPARPQRHIHCRCFCRHVRLCRHQRRPVSARAHRQGSVHRRVIVRRDAQHAGL